MKRISLTIGMLQDLYSTEQIGRIMGQTSSRLNFGSEAQMDLNDPRRIFVAPGPSQSTKPSQRIPKNLELTAVSFAAISFASSISVDSVCRIADNAIAFHQDFTDKMMNTQTESADNLVGDNMNEEDANMLALRARRYLSTTSFGIASGAAQAIRRLFDDSDTEDR